MFYTFFSPSKKVRRLWDNLEKYDGARETADDNLAAR